MHPRRGAVKTLPCANGGGPATVAAVSGSFAIAATTTDEPEAARANARWLAARIAIYGVLAVFAVIYIVPLAVLVLNAFRDYGEVNRHGVIGWPEHFAFDAFVDSWLYGCVSGQCDGIRWNFLNSLKIAIPATLVATALGVLNGFVLSKWRFRGHQWVFAGVLVGVFLPPQVTLLPWAYFMGAVRLTNNAWGLVIIHIVHGMAFTTLFCRNFFVGLPDDLVRAAKVDGASFWRIFTRVMLPLSPPILIVCVIWQFTSIWNEYLFGMVFTAGNEQPITAALMSAGAGGQSATVLIAALPPLVVYLLGGRYFVRGLTEGALK